MNDNTVKYYPLDVTKLTKGQVLTVAELEKIFNMSSSDDRWGFELMNLQRYIYKKRCRFGLPVLTTKTHQRMLIICDDGQASEYNRTMGKRGLRRFAKATYRNIHVDVTKLTDDQAKAHGRTIMRQAILMNGIRRANHQALPPADGISRTTPKMVSGPS